MSCPDAGLRRGGSVIGSHHISLAECLVLVGAQTAPCPALGLEGRPGRLGGSKCDRNAGHFESLRKADAKRAREGFVTGSGARGRYSVATTGESVGATEVVDHEWAGSVRDRQVEWSFRDEEVDRVAFGQGTSTFGSEPFEITDVAHASSNPVGDV